MLDDAEQYGFDLVALQCDSSPVVGPARRAKKRSVQVEGPNGTRANAMRLGAVSALVRLLYGE